MRISKKKDIFALDFVTYNLKKQKSMVQADKELVFSESVKAGKRIYYFDVKQSRNGDKYIAITESKRIVAGSDDDPQVSYEKHKLFLYKEDFSKFVAALTNVIDIASQGNAEAAQHYAQADGELTSDIDIQF